MEVENIVAEKRKCSKCKNFFGLALFRYERSEALTRQCKTCRDKAKESQKGYRQANKEKVSQANKAYRMAHKEHLNQQSKRYWHTNKERLNQQNRDYHATHKEQRNQQSRNYYRQVYRGTHYKRHYNIGLEEWNAAYERQGGLCAICKTVLDRGKNTHADHNHETGQFRGLLCRACNSGLGQFSDSPDRLIAAYEYLRSASLEPSLTSEEVHHEQAS